MGLPIRRRRGRWLAGWSAALFLAFGSPASHARPKPSTPQSRLLVSPPTVSLMGTGSSRQLVAALETGGTRRDVTRAVRFSVSDPRVAQVDAFGTVWAANDGEARLIAKSADQVVEVPVVVRGVVDSPPVSFARQIVPIITKAGCNGGRCHGKAEGQNGFKLSVFSFDPEGDQRAIRRDAGGRRVQVLAPERSLLLLKATSQLPHAGGQRFKPGSPEHRTLARWIAEGAKYDSDPLVPARLEVEPAVAILAPKDAQQLRVLAVDSKGRRTDVTATAEYRSNEAAIADVDERGLVRSPGATGEASIVVKYLDLVGVVRVTIPRAGTRVARPPVVNFVDVLVWNRLARLGIQPSELADDATFLRRASLDLIGTLPTTEEARAFLAECARERGPHAGRPAAKARAALVDRLLERPEYADYWAMRWADLLRVDTRLVGSQGAFGMSRWLRRQFSENVPYDRFAREILTARGSTTAESPAGFYKALEKPEVMSRSVSQLLLGVRIECAQCHHHPSERWGQSDYYALAGFFTGVRVKKLPDGEAIVAANGEDLRHPRTGQLVPPRGLGAAPASLDGVADRRVALADWATGPSNPFFARAIANRLWAHYFGRGLVEPIDDLRATNPASNEPLLDELAGHLRTLRYDLKAFTRTLLSSRVYQLSGKSNPSNATDDQGFSHAAARPMPAEVLLDAISQATGVGETFDGWPEGTRAIQVWENRMPSYFFRIFGRPERNSVCECERSNEPSIAQALHLMNSPEVGGKIRSRNGVARRLAESRLSPAEVVDELYLGTLSRLPTAAERQTMARLFQAGTSRAEAAEDVLWALVNSRDFVFNH